MPIMRMCRYDYADYAEALLGCMAYILYDAGSSKNVAASVAELRASPTSQAAWRGGLIWPSYAFPLSHRPLLVTPRSLRVCCALACRWPSSAGALGRACCPSARRTR